MGIHMDNESLKDLCLSLMKVDTEVDVINLLEQAGLWDNPGVWRYYGDRETNFNIIGNQQSKPDAALVEKIVNSVDACLINECLVRGIDPQGPSAPQSIQQAVKLFFKDESDSGTGRIRDDKRTQISSKITLAVTGIAPSRGGGNPCFTIVDAGEGQTPDMIPKTFVSLDASNKVRIPFVQGQFNMGGTGVLQFCGRHKLQFILTRRNPRISGNEDADPTGEYWGFTLVRREDPKGGLKSAVYAYLAPVYADTKPNTGEVLRFVADKMPIFPEKNEAYIRKARWGTLIKLYEYSVPGFKGHILRKDGALYKIELRLPDLALPVRLHECRQGYGGGPASFDTTAAGISVRLDEDRGQNVEDDFPTSSPMSVMGQHMTVTVYAFKKGKAQTYRNNEGILFTVNGQTQGYLTTDFFRREKVGLSYLRDSVMVIIDCTKFDEVGRADLFMTSRDRLRDGEFRKELEKVLEDFLKNHDGLRTLKERRKREEIEAKLDEDKPLENVLESILKQSPSLSSIFLLGKRLTNPFKMKDVQGEKEKFEGKKYPTYFKFRGKEYHERLTKKCHINYRARINFETDVVNDYFSRKVDRGEFSLYLVNDEDRHLARDYVGPNLRNGLATLSIKLPDSVAVGDKLNYISIVTDSTQLEPFENAFSLEILEEAKPVGKHGHRRQPPSEKEGKEREHPTGISLPKIIIVREENWNDYSPAFTKHTALRVLSDINEEEKTIYDFHINIDNIYLKTELKSSVVEPDLMQARFKYGMVLLGLALLHDYKEKKQLQSEDDRENEDESNVNIEDKIEEFTKAVAPILIPMISTLGELDLKETYVDSSSGEVT